MVAIYGVPEQKTFYKIGQFSPFKSDLEGTWTLDPEQFGLKTWTIWFENMNNSGKSVVPLCRHILPFDW